MAKTPPALPDRSLPIDGGLIFMWDMAISIHQIQHGICFISVGPAIGMCHKPNPIGKPELHAGKFSQISFARTESRAVDNDRENRRGRNGSIQRRWNYKNAVGSFMRETEYGRAIA